MVSSGTWVDVPTVAAHNRDDLQLLAVRFVDPGHPEEELGPRYRVWVRNNGEETLSRSFNVVLLASVDGRPEADSPQSGVRVEGIEPGEIQSMDIRLPIESLDMADDYDRDDPVHDGTSSIGPPLDDDAYLRGCGRVQPSVVTRGDDAPVERCDRRSKLHSESTRRIDIGER